MSRPDIESTLAEFERTDESQGKSFALALQTYIQRQVLPKLDCPAANPAGKKAARLEDGVAIPPTQTTVDDHTHYVYEGARGGGTLRSRINSRRCSALSPRP